MLSIPSGDFVILLAVAALGVGIWALVRVENVAREIGELSRRVDILARIVPRLAERLGDAAPTSKPTAHPQAADADVGATAAPPATAAPQTAAPVPRWADFEQSIASRWMIWAGGIAVALAGGFLVKYSIDHGWLSPIVRVAMGSLLGLALIAGGEWVRERPFERHIASIQPNHLPPAITAAGLFTCFASIYAAWALYDLIPPALTFVLLAATSLGAVALALVQGPLIALLGVLASFATPALVRTNTPSAIALFLYLLFPIAAALAIAHLRSWRFLAWTALAGTCAWPLLWFVGPWTSGDAAPVGLFLMLAAAMFVVLAARTPSDASVAPPTYFTSLSEPERIGWGAAAAITALGFALVRVDDYGTISLGTFLAMGALFAFAGRRQPALDGLVAVAAAATVVLVALWHQPSLIPPNGAFDPFATRPTLVPAASKFLIWTTVFGVFYAAVGFLALWGSRRPALWAGISATVPVVLLAAAYGRIAAFSVDFGWMAVALAVAGAATALASIVGRHRTEPNYDGALAAYAAAAVGALSLALAFVLREAWLTVAFALQLPALAWIAGRLGLSSLRWIAAAVATVVLARLLVNPAIIDYALAGISGFNWVLYGYGIPAVAFADAGRKFKAMADDWVVSLLYAGALAFFVLLVSFEIRVLTAGSLTAHRYGVLEQSLHTLAWLATAVAVAFENRRAPRTIWRWGSRVLAWMAFANIVLFHLLWNPMVSLEPVGQWPVFNLLLLAYAAPALACIIVSQAFARDGARRSATTFALLALVLGFVYVTFEVARAFHGTVIAFTPTTDAQSYALSLAWLVYGAALLGIGMGFAYRRLRQAGLVVVAVVIVKVFLSDMSHLTGLYRVGSFLGLGLGLLGISFLYQRFAFAPRTPQPSSTEV